MARINVMIAAEILEMSLKVCHVDQFRQFSPLPSTRGFALREN